MSQVGHAYTENIKTIVNLRGNWKFSVGDDMTWAEENYNDSNWETVYVPKSWEDNGYEDYNGFAWYRKSFQFRLPLRQKFIYLNMGQIDDVDEVYINGKLVGATGNFPPLVKTAYEIPRVYMIPTDLLHINKKNTIAARVYDEFNDGGILTGRIGLYVDTDQEKMEVDLRGYWDFECGSQIDKGNLNCITYREGKILVPGFWEARGYNGLDGQAKYTKEFEYPFSENNSSKCLFLGIIDDLDEVYFNGWKLEWYKSNRRNKYGYSNHLTYRIYKIPSYLANRDGRNRIEVIVTDKGGPGGIYKGPIGIASIETANKILLRIKKENKSFSQSFFDLFID
jgi:sialate O-acetylesterase